MSRTDRLDRAKRDLGEEPSSAEPDRLKPRPAEWMIHRILESCNGQPDGMLMEWLEQRQVFPDDIAAWCERHNAVVADWSNAGKVLQSVRGILEPPHPQATFLLGMLHALVARHAPQNADLVPLAPPGEPEPSPAPAPVEMAPAPIPKHMSDDMAALVYARAGIRNPRQP